MYCQVYTHLQKVSRGSDRDADLDERRERVSGWACFVFFVAFRTIRVPMILDWNCADVEHFGSGVQGEL
jgi:hypothetical protein